MTGARISPARPGPQVDFLIAGAQKGGTRALGHFLSQHPEIGLSRPGIAEPHFFDKRIEKAVPGDYSSYHALYTPEALGRVTGDVTPIYVFHPTALKQAQAYNPALRIIVILRDPALRAYSQWAMQAEKGWESRGFVAALIHEVLGRRSHGRHHPFFSYLERGFYAAQIAALWRIFPREQVLVLRSEDLRAHHDRELRRVWQFLGVTEIDTVRPQSVHARAYTPLPRLLRVLLRLIYTRDVRRLERMLGWNCADWRL